MKLVPKGLTEPYTDVGTNPSWARQIEIGYVSELDQPVFVDLFHQKSSTSKLLSDQVFLGRAKFKLASLAVAGGHALTAPFDPSEGPRDSGMPGTLCSGSSGS